MATASEQDDCNFIRKFSLPALLGAPESTECGRVVCDPLELSLSQ